MLLRPLEQIKKEITNYPWAKEVYEKTKAEVDAGIANFSDKVEYVAGWGHNFFCEKCSNALVFDPLHIPQDRSFVCPHCGFVNTDPKYFEAYIYEYRYAVGELLVRCALVYLVENGSDRKKYLEAIRSILTFYAMNYEKWEIHGQWAGKGRIMGQMLDEATLLANMLLCVSMVKEELDEAFMQMLNRNLFLKMADLLRPQINAIHNIALWMIATLAMRDLLYGDEDQLQKDCYGPLGVKEQLEKGATPDNIWYEESIHYHYYAITGPTILCIMMKSSGRVLDDIFTKVQNLYEAPLKILFENQRFPNPNDGWPDRYVHCYQKEFIMANNLFDSPAIAYHTALMRKAPEYTPDVYWLLYGRDDPYAPVETKSTLLPDTYFAYLKNEKHRVFMKYGFASPSHRHPDAMNIELDGYSFDLSNSGYGNPFSPAWYRRTCAHNTVAVDGKDHPFGSLPVGMTQQQVDELVKNMTQEELGKAMAKLRTQSLPGKALSFTANSVVAKTENVYAGVDFTRALTLNGDTLADVFTCESSEEHEYEYFFRANGKASFVPGTPCTYDRHENGYEYLTAMQKLPAGSTVTWVQENGKVLTFTPDADAELFVYTCPGQPAYIELTGIILRKKGSSVAFRNVFEMK